MEVYIDDEAKLTLHGLRQHYVKLKDAEKNRKLFELLDVLEFNQVRLGRFLIELTSMMLVLVNDFMITFSSSPIDLREKWLILGEFSSNSFLTLPPQGGDLREVCPAVRGSGPATHRAELPGHRHP